MPFIPDDTTNELGFKSDKTKIGPISKRKYAIDKFLSKYWTPFERGVGQGVTMGMGDEIMGALTAIEKYGSGDKRAFKDIYKLERDKQRLANESAYLKNPALYLASDLIAGLVIPMGKMKTVGQAIKSGFIRGAVEAGGRSGADVIEGDIGNLAKDIAIGGTLGGVAGGITKAATPTRKSLYETVVNQGNPKASDLKNWSNYGVTKEKIGKTILSHGGLKPSSERTLTEIITPAKHKTGGAIAEAIDNITTTLDADGLILKLENKLNEKAALPATKRALAGQINVIKNQYAGKKISANEAWNIIKGSPEIQGFDDSINYLRKATSDRALSGQDLLREGRQIASDTLDDLVKTSKDDKVFKAYKLAKKDYGNLTKAESIFTEEFFKKQEPIGARNIHTTLREKIADPVLDFLRFDKSKAFSPYFKQPEWLTTLESAPFIRGQKAATLATPFYTRQDLDYLREE